MNTINALATADGFALLRENHRASWSHAKIVNARQEEALTADHNKEREKWKLQMNFFSVCLSRRTIIIWCGIIIKQWITL